MLRDTLHGPQTAIWTKSFENPFQSSKLSVAWPNLLMVISSLGSNSILKCLNYKSLFKKKKLRVSIIRSPVLQEIQRTFFRLEEIISEGNLDPQEGIKNIGNSKELGI